MPRQQFRRFFVTAKMNGVDPEARPADFLARIREHPSMLWAWGSDVNNVSLNRPTVRPATGY
jgi:hypothetical protein